MNICNIQCECSKVDIDAERMSHLLKRKYLTPAYKHTSKKLWRKIAVSSLNLSTFYHTSQQLSLFPVLPLYKINAAGIQCSKHIFKILAVPFRGCKFVSPCPLRISENQFERTEKSLNPITLSVASFIESDGSLLGGNGFKLGVNDSGLNVQVESFKEKLQSCNSVDQILSLAEEAVQRRSLNADCLSVLFSTYHEHVYNTFTFPWLFRDLHLKKLQLEWNFLTDHIVEPHTTDTRFLNLILYSETLVEEIPYADCLRILHSLHYLFIDNSSFARKIFDRCSDNVDNFNLNELAAFSLINQSFCNDLATFGKVANAAKIWLTTHTSKDVDLDDLCTVFLNIKHLISDHMFELGTEVIISKLASGTPSINLDTINKIGFFVSITNSEYKEKLMNSILDLPSQCFNVGITNSTSDICSFIDWSSWLSPMLQRLKRHCVSELNKAGHPSMHEMIRSFLQLKSQPVSIMGDTGQSFVQFVQKSDNFLLYQLMYHHFGQSCEQVSETRELLLAYQTRLIKLFSSLSQTQLEHILSKNHGHFGLLVLNLIWKVRSSCLLVSQEITSTLDNHLQMNPNEWDAPYMKVVAATSYTIDKLKNDILLTPGDLTFLTKALNRLDFIYFMHLCKTLDSILLLPHVSMTVHQQKKSLKKTFVSKLCRTDTLSASFSSNMILPLPKKLWHQRTIGGTTYYHLMDSLPKFLKDDDEKNCLRALTILDLSVETCPQYQKETFEKLISFVTSSPKLLLYSGIQLVNVLAHAGHQPENAESFSTWTQQLTNEIMEHRLLDNSIQVHLAYYLALLGIFHDALLLKIFSLDFLLSLDQELKESPSRLLDKTKHNLALLNQSVAIECPHLDVPWFSKSVLLEKSSDSLCPVTLIESIKRLVGLTDCIVAPAESPYAHHIDVLMYVDPNSGVVKCEDVTSTQPMPDFEKIAFLNLQWHHFCDNSDFMTGKSLAGIRQLQILGYTVVTFTEKELSAMEVNIQSGLDNYVRAKIDAATHFQVFRDYNMHE